MRPRRLRSLLGVVAGLDDEAAATITLAAAEAAAAHDASADGYVPGARFHAFIIALGNRGLFDMQPCKPAKKLAAWYYGSIAGVRHMMDVGGSFERLKAMTEERLLTIAAPLDERCEREELRRRLGGIGAAFADASIALQKDFETLAKLRRLVSDCVTCQTHQTRARGSSS